MLPRRSTISFQYKLNAIQVILMQLIFCAITTRLSFHFPLNSCSNLPQAYKTHIIQSKRN